MIRTMNPPISDLMTFHAVARTGGITAAAERLGVSKSTVSLALNRLEGHLGLKLVQRTTRRLVLTPAGRQLLAHTERVQAELDDAARSMERFRDEVSGTVRLTISTASGHALLPGLLQAFRAAHPAVRFEVELTDAETDLFTHGIDVAFRTGVQRDSSLIARHLADFPIRLYGAVEMVERLGVAEQPEALERFPCIVHPAFATWSLKDARGRHHTHRPRADISSSSLTLGRLLVRSAEGVAALPDYLVAEDVRAGRVVDVLPGWSLPTMPFALTYPARLQPSRAVSTFVDFVLHHFERARTPGTEAPPAASRRE